MPRKALRLPAIFLFGLMVLYSCVIMPLYQYISFDAVLSNSVLLDLIDFLANLLEPLLIATVFGFLIHGVYEYGLGHCRPLLILTGVALLLKYILGVFTVGWMGGSFYFPDDLWSLLVSLLIECAEIALVAFLAHKLISPAKEENRILKNASETLGKEYQPKTVFFPIKRPLSRKNPLLRTAFWGMIAVLGLLTLTYAIDEILFSVSGAFFTFADLPIVLLYWFLMVLVPSITGYFVALGCILLAHKKSAHNADASAIV